LTGDIRRGPEPHNSRNILGTGSTSILLCAAKDQLKSILRVVCDEGAYPLRTANLVRGDGQIVHLSCQAVQSLTTNGLNGIAMNRTAMFADHLGGRF